MDISELIALYKKEDKKYTIEGPDHEGYYKLRYSGISIGWSKKPLELQATITERCTKAVQSSLSKPVEIQKATFKPMYGPDSRYLQSSLDDLQESFALIRQAFELAHKKGYSPRDLDSALSSEITIEALNKIL